MQRPIHARSTRNPAVPHQASAAQSAFLSEVHDDMNVSDELSRHPRSWPGVGEPKQNRTSSNVRRESLPEGSEKRLLAVPEGFHSLDSAVAATSSPPAPVACGHSGGLLQWGRRPRATESRCPRSRRSQWRCFNGAVARERRKAKMTITSLESIIALQWGRRPRATER